MMLMQYISKIFNEKGVEIFTALSPPIIIAILSILVGIIKASGKMVFSWIKTKKLHDTPVTNSYFDYTMKSMIAMLVTMIISIIVSSVVIVTLKIDKNENLLVCIIFIILMLIYLIRYYIKVDLRRLLVRSIWLHVKYFLSIILYMLGVTIGVGLGNNYIGNIITYMAIASTLVCSISYIKSEAKDMYYKIRLKTINKSRYELIDIKDIKIENDKCIVFKRDANKKLVSKKIIFNNSIEYIEYIVNKNN